MSDYQRLQYRAARRSTGRVQERPSAMIVTMCTGICHITDPCYHGQFVTVLTPCYHSHDESGVYNGVPEKRTGP
jgi:hypothetical protein